MDTCIFCKIVKGEIPATKVYEDPYSLAFLDIAPASPKGGHLLVIPKKHFEILTDMPENEMHVLMKTVQKMVGLLTKFSEGVNILQNNKAAAGQVVPHVHFHLIPRFQKDGIIVEKWFAHRYPEGEMEKTAEKLKNLLK